ncbi:MAG: hypothetical protein NUV75_02035 [Gallionella sp.]|nr:hypothetical protein [Gallionella sp.]
MTDDELLVIQARLDMQAIIEADLSPDDMICRDASAAIRYLRDNQSKPPEPGAWIHAADHMRLREELEGERRANDMIAQERDAFEGALEHERTERKEADRKLRAISKAEIIAWELDAGELGLSVDWGNGQKAAWFVPCNQTVKNRLQRATAAEAKIANAESRREKAEQRADEQTLQRMQADHRLAAVFAETRERCAKVCEKRAYERFGEFGTTEYDTGATYYEGKAGEIYESMDEEDDDCAAAIRALQPVAQDRVAAAQEPRQQQDGQMAGHTSPSPAPAAAPEWDEVERGLKAAYHQGGYFMRCFNTLKATAAATAEALRLEAELAGMEEAVAFLFSERCPVTAVLLQKEIDRRKAQGA